MYICRRKIHKTPYAFTNTVSEKKPFLFFGGVSHLNWIKGVNLEISKHMHSFIVKKKSRTFSADKKEIGVEEEIISTFVAPSSREFKGFESEHASQTASTFCARKRALGKKGALFFYKGLRHSETKEKKNGKQSSK